MYDNFYTKYEDAKIFINSVTAENVIKMLEKEKHLTAEQCAYLSKAYVFFHDYKKAVKYAKKSVKLNPGYAYGYIRLAFAYGKQAKKKECLKNLELAEQFGRDDWFIQAFLAYLYNYTENLEKSEYYLSKLLENQVNSPDYFYNVGFAYYAIIPEKHEKAIEYFEKAKEYKDKYNLYYKMMESFGVLDNIDKGLEYLEKCLAIHETQSLLERQIQCLIYLERYDEADDLSRKLYRKTDDKQQVLIFLAITAKSRGLYNKALRYLRFAYYTTDPTEYLYELAGEIYEAKKDYYAALDFYKKALKFDKYDDDILLNISYCYSMIKDYELADKYADMAIMINDKSAYSYYRKGNVMLVVERYDAAAEVFKKCIELEPEDLDYYHSISYCYSKTGQLELSFEYANRAIFLDKNSAYSYFRKAWALQEMEKYNESISCYEKCIECDSTFVDAYANISFCYSKLKDFKKSILYANKAIMVNKDYAYSHYRKAWALHNMGKFDEAIDDYIEAIELDPTDIYNYLGITGVFLDKKENFSALEFANKAIMLDRNCGNAYYYKSVALSNLGKKAEAEKIYAKARQLGFE